MNSSEHHIASAIPTSVKFAEHVVQTKYEDLPADVLDLTKVFILDTIGVGIAGSTADGAAQLLNAAAQWGDGGSAVVWGTGQSLPAQTAALINGFQVHCQEFDCVHEAAVLHPMAALLPAALGYAARRRNISGRELMVAVIAGVDVAATIGLASKSPLRFFRPATAGGFGAVAAVARLAGLDANGVVNALGAQYAQTCGTMQPHIEGSVMMPMQVGFNSRAAVVSVDLATQGIVGPVDTFEGDYGFMRLFEGEWDFAPHLDRLGAAWRIAEISHKPYPAGRAGHGAIEGVLRFLEERPFGLEDVAGVRVVGPPLIHQLTGRPGLRNPSGNYARLSASFIGAKVLLNGYFGIEHCRGDELTEARTHELAPLISVEINDVTDPNQLLPHDVIVTATDGREWRWRCESMLASPLRRLSREDHLAKFRRCCSFAAVPMRPETVEELIALVDRLETLDDVNVLTELLVR